ncbi:MAG TPA: hypothetical protein DCW37_03245 [Cellvibrionales bacterium]|nr:hypothetical protein [Cellvibrionales bacterium]
MATGIMKGIRPMRNNATQPNRTNQNQAKPNQTKPNQTKPNQKVSTSFLWWGVKLKIVPRIVLLYTIIARDDCKI